MSTNEQLLEKIKQWQDLFECEVKEKQLLLEKIKVVEDKNCALKHLLKLNESNEDQTDEASSHTTSQILQIIERLNYSNETMSMNTQSIVILTRKLEECNEKIEKLEKKNSIVKDDKTQYEIHDCNLNNNDDSIDENNVNDTISEVNNNDDSISGANEILKNIQILSGNIDNNNKNNNDNNHGKRRKLNNNCSHSDSDNSWDSDVDGCDHRDISDVHDSYYSDNVYSG